MFLLMVVLYAGSRYLIKFHSIHWLEYVEAFAEAAMVGALADWFAVTALFHHPLGIPIPHTNLIENKRKAIGDNLGGFVVANFLNPAAIRPYIERLQVSAWITAWLGREKNKEMLVREISEMLRDVLQKLDPEDVSGFLAGRASSLLSEINWHEILAKIMEAVMKDNDQERALDFLLASSRKYIIQNKNTIRELVKSGSHFLVPGFVDQLIAGKIIKSLLRNIDEIEKDPNHKFRQELNRRLYSFASGLKDNEAWQQAIANISRHFLRGEDVRDFTRSVWKVLQNGIVRDLSTENPEIHRYVRRMLAEVSGRLTDDAVMRNKIDQWVKNSAYTMVLRNSDEVGLLISRTVGQWEGKELSRKLELEVGKDLQFIRINGTVVGGIVGLLIYLVTNWLGG